MAARKRGSALVRFGKRLCAARESAGLTQARLAFIVGITVGHLSKLERGAAEALPGGDALLEMARALRVSTDHLLGLDRRDSEAPGAA